MEDEDDESEDDIDEELGYISPLENVNPYVSFKQALTSKHRHRRLSTQAVSSNDIAIFLLLSLPNAKRPELPGGHHGSRY